MTSIIEKRLSLHKNLDEQKQQNDILKSQISHLQALANIGTSACMIAHEINNLLTPLASYAALALKNPDDKPLVEKSLKKVINNCECASEVMESILAVANGEIQNKEDVQLKSMIEAIFTCLCRDFAKDCITLEIQIPEDLMIHVVPVQIQQVLMNMILNARDAMLEHGGILSIKAHETYGQIKIQVGDTGSGIAPDQLEDIFKPFFTTKADNETSPQLSGSGLGLVFCRQIVDAHGGCISVESKPEKGSTFEITLPKLQ